MNNNKELERADLHKTIWQIANELRGSVDVWYFKQYVLGLLFYRFISENLTSYLNKKQRDAGLIDFDYSKLSDEDALPAKKQIVEEKGFFILPSELFGIVVKKSDNDDDLNMTLENVFKDIESSANGTESEDNFKGLFDDIDVNSKKLGGTVVERNKRLSNLLKAINILNFGEYGSGTIDLFGDAYEYLMTMYAANAGKSGGEFFTPQEVSELLASIAVIDFNTEDKRGRTYSSKSIFSSKLVCEDCGGFYGQKVWHSTSKYRKVIWQCNKKFKDKEEKCKTPTLTAETIQMMFLDAYNTFMGNRDQVLEDCELMRQALIDFTELDAKIEKQYEEIEVIAERVRGLVKENASTPQSQDEYIKKYNSLSKRYEEEYKKLENLQKDKELRISKDKAMEVFIENLKKQPLVVDKWDESLWALIIEKAVVNRDGSIKFIFYNGTEII